jgi:hypothetical protein
MLQQCPCRTVPFHLTTSSMGLFFHSEPFVFVDVKTVQCLRYLFDGRFTPIDQDAPCMPAHIVAIPILSHPNHPP